MRDKPSQANQTVGVLSKMFRLAEAWGMTPPRRNPLAEAAGVESVGLHSEFQGWCMRGSEDGVWVAQRISSRKLSTMRRKRCRVAHSCLMRSASATSSKPSRIIETTRSCVARIRRVASARRACVVARRSSMARM